MADATTAAKDRLDRALNALELKLAARGSRSGDDEDLFAERARPDGAEARIAKLEVAGRAASAALARAAEAARVLVAAEAAPDDDAAASDGKG